jgi:ankyrin repeat protein
VEKGANLEAKNKDDETPFNLASGNGHLGTVHYLVEHGAIKTRPVLDRFHDSSKINALC